jgi:small subunit ribosomal protein S27e
MAGVFLKVKCPGCSNQQVIYSKAVSDIKCAVCEKELASSTGGKIILRVKEFTQL